MSDNRFSKWLPLCAAIFLGGGIVIGYMLRGNYGSAYSNGKFAQLLEIIDEEYVDKINIDSLLDSHIPSLLKSLDPHSAYISADELAEVNSELDGSFGGVGIQFQVMNDTICVVEVVTGGPSEKVGIKAGDRIIAVDTIDIIKRHISDQDVRNMLRGEIGTEVSVTIKRSGSDKPLIFDIVRDEIPVTSVDAYYMLNDSTGYVKVNRFARNTYGEFLHSISDLRYHGAKNMVVDLRGNVGGFMDPAVLMANEFLPFGSTIVMTRGRHNDDNAAIGSDGQGAFSDMGLVVLVDEFTASASEIFAGAIQDNDRGLILGRRSFGKGLVQRPIMLSDSSEVRLTVQRYYTPSGRCIQKEFERGGDDKYEEEIFERYNHGEIFSEDSIAFDPSKMFTTRNGRIVYGGGGIMPDVFVPSDTTGVSSYYINVYNAGLPQKYAYEMADLNREQFSKAKDVEALCNMLPSDWSLLQSFVSYAAQNGVPASWHYINISSKLLVNDLKALIARDVLGFDAYYKIHNTNDNVVAKAVEMIERGETTIPVTLERLNSSIAQQDEQ